MMALRPLARPILLLSLMLASRSGLGQSSLEFGINRPGGDFRDFPTNRAAPGVCQIACQQDPRCRAFTYVKPGVQGPDAHCWLKSTVPPAVQDPNCVSGTVQLKLEAGINRPGGDFFSFPMKLGASPNECHAACQENARCRAFTYVKPGVQGPEPHCWLKSIVPKPVKDPNCVSGIVPRVGMNPR
jgi:hypothetical protein